MRVGGGEGRRGFLGLGSNQGDREAHLRAALEGLSSGGADVAAVSTLFETDPVGVYEGEQPDFLNAVASVRTAIDPEALLDLCKRIEVSRGRDLDGPRHGPRPLDIDILLLGDLELSTPRLTIPHAGLLERRFVLEPLIELEPAIALPDGTELAPILARLPLTGVRRLGPLR